MTPSTPPVDPTRWYQLPVMWLVVLLPLLAFVGGGLMVVLTSVKPDPEVYSERLEAPAPVNAPGG
jgi:hypothetical protein